MRSATKFAGATQTCRSREEKARSNPRGLNLPHQPTNLPEELGGREGKEMEIEGGTMMGTTFASHYRCMSEGDGDSRRGGGGGAGAPPTRSP